MKKTGFDNELYVNSQIKTIKERIKMFDNKLYLEFGGKLFDDYHAKRVLPGFKLDSKIRLLEELKAQCEIIFCINAKDIEKKIRADYGISYDMEVMRLIEVFRKLGIQVNSVVITLYKGQSTALRFQEKLENMGVKTYFHTFTKGYPTDVDVIVSEEGYGANPYIETTKPLVIVNAPGPCSGKLATCLSQLYHEHKRGIKAGYAKFETFPVWNLPLKHPVNLAYEAATADLNDVNMIDPYHLEAYGETTVNYNRDVEVFPVLNAMFEKIEGVSPYKSPTDMGVNMAGYCIIDDKVCCKASYEEIVRRYFNTLCDKKRGHKNDAAILKIESLMNQAGISVESERPTVKAALTKSEETGNRPAVAIELPCGKIVTGKTSDLLGSASAALLNALKVVSEIDDEKLLIQREVIEPIQLLKTNILGNHNPRLHTDEVLIALTMSAVTNKDAKKAFDSLKLLKGSEAHATVMLSQVDLDTFRKLGINITCEPQHESKKLYHK